jgi:hypothetical protein
MSVLLPCPCTLLGDGSMGNIIGRAGGRRFLAVLQKNKFVKFCVMLSITIRNPHEASPHA